MEHKITRVTNETDTAAVAGLADEIWHEHFIPIIGEPQVNYMLNKFQSSSAIASQRQSGTEYYLVATDDLYAGYMGLVPDHQNRKMMISKLYVRREARGTGIGGLLLDCGPARCLEFSAACRLPT